MRLQPRRALTRGPSSLASAVDHRQSRRLIFGEDRIDDLVERLAAHHLVDLVKGQVDPMIGDPALRKIVGADALRSVAAAALPLSPGGTGAGAGLPLHLVKTRAQNLERSRLVLVLGFLVLLNDNEPGRQMGNPYSAVGRVDRLAARTARPKDVDAQILLVDP